MSEPNEEVEDEDPDAKQLDDADELLYRQVHPSWIQDGEPSSLAFRPTKKDAGELSIALSSLTTPEGAYLHHTEVLRLASAGTWAVTVGEAIGAGFRSFAQPLHNSPDHGFIDFRGLSRSVTETRAKLLLPLARSRGRLHP